MKQYEWGTSDEYQDYCERMSREPHLFAACPRYRGCSEAWRKNVIPGCDTCHHNIDAEFACIEFRRRWNRLFHQ